MNTEAIKEMLHAAAGRSLAHPGCQYSFSEILPFSDVGGDAFNAAYGFETEQDSLLDTQTDAETNCLFLLLVAEAISE